MSQQKPSQKPKVSVITATYNRAHLLPVTVLSIRQQTFTEWEMLLLDDGSTDTTQDVIQKLCAQEPRIRPFRQERNRGAASRNTLFRQARGDYIAFQDDDDISLPQRLQKQVDFLDQHPRYDLVSPWMANFRENGFIDHVNKTRFTSFANKPPPLSAIATGYTLSSPCLMMRRKIIDTLTMRHFFPVAEDFDFLLRAMEQFNLTHMPEILYHYRLGDTRHKTLSTSRHATHRAYSYHIMAWTCAFHRRQGWKEPIHKATHLDEAVAQIHPQFQKLAKKSLEEFYRFFFQNLTHYPSTDDLRHVLFFLQRVGGETALYRLIQEIFLETRNANDMEETCHAIRPLAHQPFFPSHHAIRSIPPKRWRQALRASIHKSPHHVAFDIALMRHTRPTALRVALLPVILSCLFTKKGRASLHILLKHVIGMPQHPAHATDERMKRLLDTFYAPTSP